MPRLLRKQSKIEAQHAVCAHLQQDTSQQHRASSRRFHVRIWQPGVNREQWDLDGERDKESQEEPGRSAREIFHLAIADRILDGHEIKAAYFDIEPQNRCQHEDRRDHRVQEKLYCRINPASVTINADEQRHRDQRGFPKEIKQE